jgi:hypothetical protein
MKDNHTVVLDAAIYEKKDVNIYEIFEFANLKNGSHLLNQTYGGVFKRFEIDLETKKVLSYDLAKMESGNYDLPTYNDKYDGVKENCITYLVGMFEK